MKWWRGASVGLLLVALVVSSSRASEHANAQLVAAPCSASVLSSAYHGTSKVDSVQNFGCVGDWAFLWATIGSGIHEIGVTEVVHFDHVSATWKNAPRLTYCNHHLLPTYVEFWGCNSN